MLKLNDPTLFRQQACIDGAWCDADEGKTVPVINPATGETLGTVPHMGAAETRRAIEAARKSIFSLRATEVIGDDAFHRLEEELDRAELSAGG